MRNTLNLIVGVYALLTVVYKIATCPSCPDSIFGMEISGLVYILIWTFAAAAILYGVYKRKQDEQEVQ